MLTAVVELKSLVYSYKSKWRKQAYIGGLSIFPAVGFQLERNVRDDRRCLIPGEGSLEQRHSKRLLA
jgi:hypothetical protein